MLYKLFFAALHNQYEIYVTFILFLTGLLFGWARFKSGSVLLTIVLHSFNILSVIALTYFLSVWWYGDNLYNCLNMGALNLRLKRLEKIKPFLPLIVILKHDRYSAEQEEKIKEAEARNQPVKIVRIYTVDADGQRVDD